MPLAAMVPLGIITVALGVAGLGMGGVHYAFTGEVRDRFSCPSTVGPRFASNRAPLNTCVHWRWRPPSRPPSSRAPASYRCTRCRPPLPPQRAISKSLHTPSHPPALPAAPALEVGQARVWAAEEEETAAVGGGSGVEGSGGPGCGGSLTPLLPFPCRELTYDPVCCAQRNKPLTDRWKEALYDRDRMIKAHYGSGTA